MEAGTAVVVSATLFTLTTLLAINFFGLPAGLVAVCTLMSGMAAIFAMACLFGSGGDCLQYMEGKEGQKFPKQQQEKEQASNAEISYKNDHAENVRKAKDSKEKEPGSREI